MKSRSISYSSLFGLRRFGPASSRLPSRQEDVTPVLRETECAQSISLNFRDLPFLISRSRRAPHHSTACVTLSMDTLFTERGEARFQRRAVEAARVACESAPSDLSRWGFSDLKALITGLSQYSSRVSVSGEECRLSVPTHGLAVRFPGQSELMYLDRSRDQGS